ncbi:CLUMA_CG007427, isoform A [Clunio marinus]|uniref:CLUMA_CG007427, isoform A n=1 Tax=Clunio marinus TaxID=568069 RepID=A0A1J1I2T4_9DIPT|nr:CLUMA_CG007427, isoform A [Clunio marinus]
MKFKWHKALADSYSCLSGKMSICFNDETFSRNFLAQSLSGRDLLQQMYNLQSQEEQKGFNVE